MYKSYIRVIFTALLMFGLILTASSCAGEAENGVSGEREYADPIAENILQSLNDDNYAGYCENFDQAMKGAVTEEVFDQFYDFIKSKVGDYKSKEYWKVETEDIYTIVYYKAKFTKETADVEVRVVFRDIEGEMYVSGLWFDSPKLREE